MIVCGSVCVRVRAGGHIGPLHTAVGPFHYRFLVPWVLCAAGPFAAGPLHSSVQLLRGGSFARLSFVHCAVMGP